MATVGRRPKKRSNQRGSLLIECGISFSLFFFMLVLNCELIRVGWFHAVLGHAAFLTTRDRAMGVPSPRCGERRERWLKQVFGKATDVNSAFVWGQEQVERGGIIETFHFRYPTLVKFSVKEIQKHHLEMSPKCRFPF